MWLPLFLVSWTAGLSRRRRPEARPARPRSFRPLLEALEDRCVPASYTAANASQLSADITAANAAGGSNTITLTAPTTSPYVLTTVNNTTNGANGLPVIAANDNLTIVGNGDTIERSTATGTPDFRLLQVASGGSLTLENLTLQGGVASGEGDHADGGAIYSLGTLVLTGVTVQDNSAEGSATGSRGNAAGGGICAGGGSVTLEGGTIVQNNDALGYNALDGGRGGYAYGGGLYASGATVIVTNATLDNNTARGGYGVATGPGPYELPSEDPYSYGYGGGLYASGGTVILTNATLDGNVAEQISGAGGGAYGGGLYLAEGTTGSATLTNCTVQGNSALYGVAQGGGIYIPDSGVSLDAATVAQVTGNTASSGAAYDNIVGPYTLT